MSSGERRGARQGTRRVLGGKWRTDLVERGDAHPRENPGKQKYRYQEDGGQIATAIEGVDKPVGRDVDLIGMLIELLIVGMDDARGFAVCRDMLVHREAQQKLADKHHHQRRHASPQQ